MSHPMEYYEYEYRFWFGHNDERKATPWMTRNITPEDLQEWREDFANVTAERRFVKLDPGTPESYEP